MPEDGALWSYIVVDFVNAYGFIAYVIIVYDVDAYTLVAYDVVACRLKKPTQKELGYLLSFKGPYCGNVPPWFEDGHAILQEPCRSIRCP